MKTYLIDYELTGSLVVESNNPQAASARAQAVLRAVNRGLCDEGSDPDMRIGPATDLATKTTPRAS